MPYMDPVKKNFYRKRDLFPGTGLKAYQTSAIGIEVIILSEENRFDDQNYRVKATRSSRNNKSNKSSIFSKPSKSHAKAQDQKAPGKTQSGQKPALAAGRFSRGSKAEKKPVPGKPSGGTPSGVQGEKKGKTQNAPGGKNTKFNVKRLIKTLILAVLAVCLVVGVVFAVKVFTVVQNAPDVAPSNIYDLLSENSFMYDSQGNLLENVMDAELRTNLDYSQMPQNLLNAFVAIEDKTFWEHKGFNFVRIMGAIWESITQGESISGTSTITQQLARNLYLEDTKSDRTMVRKATEAYYTVLLERNLTKEQIIEAYLNTIALGFNTYGVEAAAQTYFGKSASELTLAECSALATIPRSPSRYALIKRYYNEDVDESIPAENILATTNEYTLVYNDAFKDRQKIVLDFMEEYGYITAQENQEAYSYDIRQSLNPSTTVNSMADVSSYYIDYAKDQVIEILMTHMNLDQEAATHMLYNGGLKIYTAMDQNIQKIIETEFQNNSNFPGIRSIRRDSSGNIIGSDGRIMLYDKSNYFDGENRFVIKAGEYGYDDAGNLYLYQGFGLQITPSYANEQLTDVALNFRNMYTYEGSTLYAIYGGSLKIDAAYKSVDANGNAIIHKEFLDANPDFFVAAGDSLTVSAPHYTLPEGVIQPQSAMVIMDQATGEIKAMVGGRNMEGSQLYNRADSPRQPGSSIKPIAVYLPAMLNGYTAGTSIEDSENIVNGKVWPRNSYSGYKGWITVRTAIQTSSNVVAVRVINSIGYDTSRSFLEQLGITTVTDDDLNPAALGLGGMSKGLKPIESTGAFATIASGGVYHKPTTINRILNKNDEVIYDLSLNETRQVFDEGTAYIMTDMLKGVVSGGTGGRARLYAGNATIPVAGKTGTTTNNYDAWFCGYTPYYTAALWIGNDVNIQLSNGSGAAAQLWSNIMRQVHSGLEAKNFERPDSVVTRSVRTQNGTISELFVEGTSVPEYKGGSSSSTDNQPTTVTVCNESGMLATSGCPSTRTIPAEGAPAESCNIHAPASGGTPVTDPSQVPDGLGPDENVTPPDDPNVDYVPQQPDDSQDQTGEQTPPVVDSNPSENQGGASEPETPPQRPTGDSGQSSDPAIPEVPSNPSSIPDGL